MKRGFDVVLALCAGVALLLPTLLIALLVRLSSPGPLLYWSDRVSRHNRIFKIQSHLGLIHTNRTHTVTWRPNMEPARIPPAPDVVPVAPDR